MRRVSAPYSGAVVPLGIPIVENPPPLPSSQCSSMATIGVLQVTRNWASLTASGSIAVTVDLGDTTHRGAASVAIDVDGRPYLRGTLPWTAVAIK